MLLSSLSFWDVLLQQLWLRVASRSWRGWEPDFVCREDSSGLKSGARERPGVWVQMDTVRLNSG